MSDMIDLSWLIPALERQLKPLEDDWKKFSEARMDIISSVKQVEIVRDSIEPFIKESIKEAHNPNMGREEAVDLLVKALHDIHDFIILQPTLVEKEIEKFDIAIQSTSARISEIKNTVAAAISRKEYLRDLEDRISKGEVEVSPKPGERRRGRKPGTKPDKLKDVRQAASRVKKKEAKKDSSVKENKED